MFTAYFDASGTKRQRVLSVSGFVAQQARWEAFETSWKNLLPPTVEMFHMTDFVSSQKGWESWKNKSRERAVLLAGMVKCIRKHTRKGFAISMAMKDYRAVDAQYMLSERVDTPYTYVVMGGLLQLKKWAENNGIDYRNIVCCIEEGDDGSGNTISLAKADGFNAIPQNKRHIRAFDSCDFAAWKSKAALDDTLYRPFRDHGAEAFAAITKSLNQLDSIVQLNQILTRNAMLEMCQRSRVPKRPSRLR